MASSFAKFLPSLAMLNGGKFCVSRLTVSWALAEANGSSANSAPRTAERRVLLRVGMLKSRVDRTLFYERARHRGRVGCRQCVACPQRSVTDVHAASNGSRPLRGNLCSRSLMWHVPLRRVDAMALHQQPCRACAATISFPARTVIRRKPAVRSSHSRPHGGTCRILAGYRSLPIRDTVGHINRIQHIRTVARHTFWRRGFPAQQLWSACGRWFVETSGLPDWM